MTPKRGQRPLRVGALLLGFDFLYAPIVLLVIYSFNASRLVTVWAGFSTRWYGELWRNEAFGAAAVTSLRGRRLRRRRSALVLGAFAGFSLSRFARFPGRRLFGFALLAPLVVPESSSAFPCCCSSSPAKVVRLAGPRIVTITVAHATSGVLCRGAGARPIGRF